MLSFNSRTAMKVARNLTAFVRFDAGLVRGEVPDPERQLQQAQKQLRDKTSQLRQALDQKPPQANNQQNPQQKQARLRDDAQGHRLAVGGRWEEIGALQFEFLRENGLRPEYSFLDVGCGSLRGGIHFISYLEPGRYYGIDRSQRMLDAGWGEVQAARLQRRLPSLTRMEDFGFERLDQTFDYALAQSVFTHLPLNLISRCLVNMDRVLRPGGTFFATYFENRKGKQYLDSLEQADGIVTHYDRDPFHYTPDAFEWASGGTSLSVERIGEWKHPRNQYMLAFRKAK